MPFPELFAELLQNCRPMALAFSGGLDSRFLAHSALALLPTPGDLCLIHVCGPHVPEDESRAADAWARARGLQLIMTHFDPLEIEAVRSGWKDRCYYCKKAMFLRILQTLETMGATAGNQRVLCDGSNASDNLAWRPGLAALRELGVRSPLAEAGLDKQDISALGAASGLDNPRQKARPCLLTRFAYGLEPDKVTLAALEAAERAVSALLTTHAQKAEPPDFRLRLVSRRAAAKPGKPLSVWQSELHVEAELPDALVRELEALLAAAGFDPGFVLCLEQVSGHYDK
ncbi:PP-loop family protein [Desulfovibrio sp. OttesenSCG-928-M14]|nr:PP-loop family protein [Desulfovibrio sp. OttesenSCG-928-M14]